LHHPLVDVVVPAELAPGEALAQRLARHPDQDILLVESRAALREGAQARLAACARQEASIATVSAFSAGGPFAYCAPAAADELDAHFANENVGMSIEIPEAVPPCVYITRRALDECGPLEAWDAAALASFCARASATGFVHVLCGSVRSEGTPSWPLPEGDAWEAFARRATDTPLRRRVDLARLRASPRPRVLFVTHQWGGGVQLHVNDLARLLANDCEVLVLSPGVEDLVSLQWLREGERLQAWFDAASEWDACRDLLRAIGIARVHFHHVHGLRREALELPKELGVPYDVTLHDHFAICPQYHLADENGRYCGEPDAAGCGTCLAKRPAQWGLDIAGWRGLFERLLREADRVIAPSSDIGTRIQRYFPDVRPQVWPHPELRLDAPRVHKVVILGGLSAIKGMDLFEACVRDAQARALPLYFEVLGHISRPLDVGRDAPVRISGSYGESQIATLVEIARPDAFLFLSQVPETFSYTLSMAMRASKPIVATSMGAFTERLRAYPSAALVAPDASAGSVNDALMRLLQAPAKAPERPLAMSAGRA
jgi:glycosyltransferase involved in cell wall biosynthesis